MESVMYLELKMNQLRRKINSFSVGLPPGPSDHASTCLASAQGHGSC